MQLAMVCMYTMDGDNSQLLLSSYYYVAGSIDLNQLPYSNRRKLDCLLPQHLLTG